MKKVVFIVPLCKLVLCDKLLFHDTLCEKFGGFTKYEIKGGWFNPETGKVEYDLSYKYEVLTDKVEVLKAYIIALNKRWKEDCIYFEVVDTDVHFIK